MTELLTTRYFIKTSGGSSGLLHFYNNEKNFLIRCNEGQRDTLDILIKLGRTRMRALVDYLGLSHERVLRCSQLSQAEMFFLHKVTHPADVKLYKHLLSWPLKQVEDVVKKLSTAEIIFSFLDQIQQIKCRKRQTSHGGSSKLSEVVKELKKILIREEVCNLMETASNVTGESNQLHSSPNLIGPKDLTKEIYLQLKQSGLTNQQIMKQYSFKSSGSFYYALEKLGVRKKRTKGRCSLVTDEEGAELKMSLINNGEMEPGNEVDAHAIQSDLGPKQDYQDPVAHIKDRTINYAININDICKILFPEGVPVGKLNDYNLIFLVISKICELVDCHNAEFSGLIWKEIVYLSGLGCVNSEINTLPEMV